MTWLLFGQIVLLMFAWRLSWWITLAIVAGVVSSGVKNRRERSG
jgi:hypothetical protein